MTIEEGMIVEETIIVDTGIMMTITEILKEIEVIVGKTGKSKLRVPEGKKPQIAGEAKGGRWSQCAGPPVES